MGESEGVGENMRECVRVREWVSDSEWTNESEVSAGVCESECVRVSA